MSSPIILATWSFGTIANAEGWNTLAEKGSALDAVERASIAIEADPQVNSVGFGGIPDRDGRVSLDGCIMTSPAQRGAVCFVRHHIHPVSIARRVMEQTPHVMLAGQGADEFADAQGFLRADLLTDEATARWEALKSEQAAGGTTPQANREEQTGKGNAPKNMPSRNGPHDEPSHDTVSILAIDAEGTLAGACSTSGLALKIPGRVGDSPIIGQGLYVHPDHGAAVATGTGELVMGVCGTFLAVESMRNGATPAEAIHLVLQRIRESYDIQPDHQVGMIALSPQGEWAHAALVEGYRTAVRTADRDELVECETLISD